MAPNYANGLKKDSEMLIFHIRSVAKDRLVKKIGNIEKGELDFSIKTLNDLLKY